MLLVSEGVKNAFVVSKTCTLQCYKHTWDGNMCCPALSGLEYLLTRLDAAGVLTALAIPTCLEKHC